ncbi:MAG: hypothetical protein BWX47_02062 [candidate division Hyd24-12 bacterium ADurb.Bin004]|nr:MAG: hypothetical protein BWX47_02062 [candidate division Hyd24-12 bacterium ADurb.Bin004]
MRAVEPSLQQKPGEDGYPHRESGHVAPHDRPGPLPRYQVVPRYGAGAFGEYEEGEDGRQPFQGDAVVEVLQEPAARKKRTRPHDGEEDGEGRGRVDRLPPPGAGRLRGEFHESLHDEAAAHDHGKDLDGLPEREGRVGLGGEYSRREKGDDSPQGVGALADERRETDSHQPVLRGEDLPDQRGMRLFQRLKRAGICPRRAVLRRPPKSDTEGSLASLLK